MAGVKEMFVYYACNILHQTKDFNIIYVNKASIV